MLTEQTQVGLLAKLNVADVDKSADWYETKLGLTLDPRFDTEDWRQLNVPGVTGAALGLWQGSPTGSGGTDVTFVVADIETMRASLIANGVEVGPIESPGRGVEMATFVDIDGNALALRQNPASQPSPSEIGHQ
ncbi:MAG: VOC family protein [Catenulispora sp.]